MAVNRISGRDIYAGDLGGDRLWGFSWRGPEIWSPEISNQNMTDYFQEVAYLRGGIGTL